MRADADKRGEKRIMAAPDKFHDVVKHALIKDGWTITDDPLYLDYGGVDYSVDFGAEKLIGAEKHGQRIAVEVKSFLSDSTTYEFHHVVGQFTDFQKIWVGPSQVSNIKEKLC